MEERGDDINISTMCQSPKYAGDLSPWSSWSYVSDTFAKQGSTIYTESLAVIVVGIMCLGQARIIADANSYSRIAQWTFLLLFFARKRYRKNSRQVLLFVSEYVFGDITR